MTILNHIQHIREGIQEGRFTSEAAVSQGIILPTLQQLGWPVFDISIVIPEFSIEGRRVDYALCHPSDKPYLFIEVKKIGFTAGADRQLFEYAFHLGVPMAILTDGQEWSFYLPGEQGRYDERRVYKIDLLERDIPEAASRLKRYAGYENICSGEALKSARSDYQDIAKERIIETHIPKAWESLLNDQESLLLEMLAEKTEDLCGYRPSLDLCSRYIDTQSKNHKISEPSEPRSKRRGATGKTKVQPKIDNTPFNLVFKGEKIQCNSAVETMTRLFRLLYEEDSKLFERFISRKHGRKRRYLAKEKIDLYPGRKDLVEQFSTEVAQGWWLGTNYSRKNIQDIINLALEVAGPQLRDMIQARVI